MTNNLERKADNDPLRDERKKAQRISQNLERQERNLDITVLGTLHVGNIGNGIRSVIDAATSVSCELPSITVRSRMEGGWRERRKLKNGFWRQVLDYCKETGKPVIGVNNNRGAVNTLRVLDNRTKDFKVSKKGPDVLISTEDPEFAEILKQEAPSLIPERKTPTFPILPSGHFDADSYPEFIAYIDGPFPYVGGFEAQHPRLPDRQKFYYYQYRQVSKDRPKGVKVAPFELSLPTAYYLDHAEEDFNAVATDKIVAHNFAQSAVGHLVRLWVDKAQVDGMLKPLDVLLKGGVTEDLRHLHLGGVFHNTNLTRILRNVFQDSSVSVHDVKDERMPDPYENILSIFSSVVDPTHGLLASEMYQDHALVKVHEAGVLFQDAATKLNGELLHRLGEIAEVVGSYRKKVKQEDNSAHFGSYIVTALMLLAPNVSVDKLKVTEDLPSAVALIVLECHPELRFEVNRLMEMYARRKDFYPRHRLRELIKKRIEGNTNN